MTTNSLVLDQRQLAAIQTSWDPIEEEQRQQFLTTLLAQRESMLRMFALHEGLLRNAPLPTFRGHNLATVHFVAELAASKFLGD